MEKMWSVQEVVEPSSLSLMAAWVQRPMSESFMLLGDLGTLDVLIIMVPPGWKEEDLGRSELVETVYEAELVKRCRRRDDNLVLVGRGMVSFISCMQEMSAFVV